MATDIRIEKLMDWGIDTVFGLPGDGINGRFASSCRGPCLSSFA
jgi:thiamine pyrophosphate-dependent acetolactate synthase large subunit-like protein